MCCSMRRECTRTDRRACGGRPWTGGSHGPVNCQIELSVNGHEADVHQLVRCPSEGMA